MVFFSMLYWEYLVIINWNIVLDICLFVSVLEIIWFKVFFLVIVSVIIFWCFIKVGSLIIEMVDLKLVFKIIERKLVLVVV